MTQSPITEKRAYELGLFCIYGLPPGFAFLSTRGKWALLTGVLEQHCTALDNGKTPLYFLMNMGLASDVNVLVQSLGGTCTIKDNEIIRALPGVKCEIYIEGLLNHKNLELLEPDNEQLDMKTFFKKVLTCIVKSQVKH